MSKNWNNIGSTTSSSANTQRCYHTHPPYPVTDSLVIYGGSCCSPAINDMDVHIGFDVGMLPTLRRFPWEAGEEIYFKVFDRDIPSDEASYRRLVEWTAEQLTSGRKVHAGCIGGHGRTGMFLAALRAYMANDPKAITHVREHYCKKAVESEKQVEFLHRAYGCEKVAGTDGFKAYGGSSGHASGSNSQHKSHGFQGGKTNQAVLATRNVQGTLWSFLT